MALSYYQTAWNSAGTSRGTDLYSKDLTFTAAAGDRIVAFATAENTSGTSITNQAISTVSGSTSSWTRTANMGLQNDSVSFVTGTATVTTGGSITIRGTVCVGIAQRMGVAAAVIPAAEWEAYTSTTAFGENDADGQVSVTVPSGGATYTAIYMVGDWSASNPGTTATPTGGTNRVSYYDTTRYAVFAETWTEQAAGTRNYGPTYASRGTDYWTGAVVLIEEPSAGVTATPTAVATSSAIPTPTVTATSNATITPTAVAGTATVPAPTVSAGATVVPTAVAGTATVLASTVTAGSAATPTAIAAIATIGAPTVTAGATVITTTVAATAAVATPTVTTATSATVTPTVVAGAASVGTPTLSVGSTVTPTVVAGTTTAPTPTVSASNIMVRATLVALGGNSWSYSDPAVLV